ncbi:GTP pyrophosphokinase (plasmid) [Burkholderia ambifaria]
MESRYEHWLDGSLIRHNRLTEVVVTLMKSLLASQKIDCLAVTGRTKDRQSALEKIVRKGYKDPSTQLTDLSGIRVIVFLESDVERVSKIIQESFNIDQKNSHNPDIQRLSVSENGYRSVHFVCDLGEPRAALPEFQGLSGLKFEFQVRTVLQHAWAELAHDRNYKFNSQLPRDLERQLFLYAGLLEIADKGFNELSQKIDKYVLDLQQNSEKNASHSSINSLSLVAFVDKWCADNGFELEPMRHRQDVADIVRELRQLKIETLEELMEIIPEDYAGKAKSADYATNLFGLVRDWMIISDWRRFLQTVNFDWLLSPAESKIYHKFMSDEEVGELYQVFPTVDDEPYDPDGE